MSKKDRKYVAYVVPQTHWDRAWYLSFEHFRIRLVRLTENLLKILEKNPKYRFTFDGQTVVLEDVLQVRPEFEKALTRHVKSKALSVGPWYVLPDEFLVSGEALVRNLLIGHQVAKRFGRVMKAGYIPDPFGHVSQLPQILKGFGIDSVLFMRGIGEEGDNLNTEFRWIAPDGETAVIACHLIGGYGNLHSWGRIHGVALEDERVDFDQAVEHARNAINHLIAHRPTTNVLLLNNGVDHLPAQPSVPAMIKYTNEKLDNCKLIQGDYEEYVEALKKAKPRLKPHQGELHNGRYFPLLSGVFSARMYLKQANERCLRLLEAYAEPLSAMNFVLGGQYPGGFLTYAWKETLKNHPHDDICGCSIDAVHRDMVSRFAHSRQVSEALTDQALGALTANTNTANGPKGAAVVAFNPSTWQRNEPVRIRTAVPAELIADGKATVVDGSGKTMHAKTVVHPVREQHHWRDGKLEKSLVVDVDAEFMAEALPSFGLKTFYVTAARGKDPKPSVTARKTGLENEFFRLSVNKNGTLKVEDKSTRKVYPSLHLIEDIEDVGDEYDYSPLPQEATETFLSTKCGTVSSVKVLEDLGFKATLGIEQTLRIPKEVTPKRKRSSAKVAVSVKTLVSLSAGSRRIDFTTTINNTAEDHRMRVLFPTGICSDKVYAAGKFDVLERSLNVPKGEGWCQPPVPTKHVDGFVSVNDNRFGFTVINRGLPEYEAQKGKDGVTLCQTLFRSVEWLSRGDMQTRSGHAGRCGQAVQRPGP
ncbi:MAG TPA: glycoside hydrolase family 38 C-terminal domain-containing protein, partial [bacterium]|nr:glycoside hydrolase family 38 C-terminal domain-containing protein [bacterium]